MVDAEKPKKRVGYKIKFRIMKTLDDVKKIFSEGSLTMNRNLLYLTHFEDGEYVEYLIAVYKKAVDEDTYGKFSYTSGKRYNIAVVASVMGEFTYGLFEEELDAPAITYTEQYIEKAVRIFDSYLEQFEEYIG